MADYNFYDSTIYEQYAYSMLTSNMQQYTQHIYDVMREKGIEITMDEFNKIIAEAQQRCFNRIIAEAQQKYDERYPNQLPHTDTPYYLYHHTSCYGMPY